MKAQPYKKALKHLDKAENFQERLRAHMQDVRTYLEQMAKEDGQPKTPKKKRRPRN